MKGSIDQSRPRARCSRRRAEIMAYSVKWERDRRVGGGRRWRRQGRTGQCSSRRSALKLAQWPSGEGAGAPRAKDWVCWPRAQCGPCSGRPQQFTAVISPLDLNLNDESEWGISFLYWKRIRRRRRRRNVKSYLCPFLGKDPFTRVRINVHPLTNYAEDKRHWMAFFLCVSLLI